MVYYQTGFMVYVDHTLHPIQDQLERQDSTPAAACFHSRVRVADSRDRFGSLSPPSHPRHEAARRGPRVLSITGWRPTSSEGQVSDLSGEGLDLEHVRGELERERQRLRRLLTGEADEENGDEGVRTNPDRSDLAQAYIRRERETALISQRREQLEQVEAALERMERDAYGVCQLCGDPIQVGRLEALPYATMCAKCQSKQERR